MNFASPSPSVEDNQIDPCLIESDKCKGDPWEAAYLRFETSGQEVRKFVKRLMIAGAACWPHDAEIVELFCGRGNGLHALSRLGFTRLAGVDLSFSLLNQYKGDGKVCVSDCRKLPFKNQCKDFVIIQGGLHHLHTLPDDLDQTLSETRRILKDDGIFVLVEPWLTPFLSLVHAVCRNGLARTISRKVDSLATMILYERETYEQWLNQPQMIVTLLTKYFHKDQCSFGWGKLVFVGRKRAATHSF